jgi:hypothetical protein
MAAKSITSQSRNAVMRKWDSVNPLVDPPTETYSQSAFHTNAVLASQGHRGHKDLGSQRGDIGGTFHLLKHTYDEKSHGTDDTYFYVGAGRWERTDQYAVAEHVNDTSFPAVTPTPDHVLGGMGAHAISKVLPTSPRVNCAAMAGELLVDGATTFRLAESLATRSRDLRKLPPRKRGEPRVKFGEFREKDPTVGELLKDVGAGHLEAQFAWIPFLQDLKTLQYVIDHSNQLIEAYVANSGKRLKRKFHFPIDTSSSVESTGQYPSPRIGLTRNPYNGAGKLLEVTESRHEIWFEGCFTYNVPPVEPGKLFSARNLELYQYLYGYEVNPAVIWQIAPWSWAIDWASNIGDVAKNFSELADGGLVLEYGYVMEHRKVSKRYYHTQQWGYSDDELVVPSSLRGSTTSAFQSFETEMKYRIPVGPYDLDISWEGLTPYQGMIAAALGFARGGR